VITQLICHFDLHMSDIEQKYLISFGDYFANELAELKSMELDGLLVLSKDRIVVEPKGKLLIRNICMVFDAYLRQVSSDRFSKVI
jgi:oxygen-independent coproporphyrinogen-3 oxidase